MKLSDLPDPRLRRLASNVQATERKIVELLTLMVDAPLAQRTVLFRAVEAALDDVRKNTRAWARRHFVEFFNTAHDDLVRSLESAGITPASITEVRRLALDGLMLAFSERIDAALFSIYSTASRLLRSTDTLDAVDPRSRQVYTRKVNAGVAPTTARSAALNSYREFLKAPATIQGASGTTRHYELAYYVSMVGSSAFVQAHNLPARLQSQLLDLDLVRVSKNSSLIGDYCDDYKGKVFSLSGRHPVFPALDRTPNGGPPFHVHCYHFLTLVPPTEDLSNEIPVEDSALLRPGETSTKRLASRHKPHRARRKR
jgi:hypothetical protein